MAEMSLRNLVIKNTTQNPDCELWQTLMKQYVKADIEQQQQSIRAIVKLTECLTVIETYKITKPHTQTTSKKEQATQADVLLEETEQLLKESSTAILNFVKRQEQEQEEDKKNTLTTTPTVSFVMPPLTSVHRCTRSCNIKSSDSIETISYHLGGFHVHLEQEKNVLVVEIPVPVMHDAFPMLCSCIEIIPCTQTVHVKLRKLRWSDGETSEDNSDNDDDDNITEEEEEKCTTTTTAQMSLIHPFETSSDEAVLNIILNPKLTRLPHLKPFEVPLGTLRLAICLFATTIH